MMKEIISNSDGIGIFGILSLLSFFTCFLVVSWRAWELSNNHADEMAAFVLEDADKEINSKEK